MSGLRYPRVIAHRCGGGLAPENTLAGLRIAARLGCRAVEFDVMLSADGVPVLIHDETVDRTTVGHGAVALQSCAALRALDAGSAHGPAFRDERIPTFAEALALCAALGLWANVEIKPSPGREAETGAAVGAMLAQHWPAGRPAASPLGAGVISSFSVAALRAARQASPDGPRALLVETLPDDWPVVVADLGCAAVHCHAGNDGKRLAAVAEAGLALACYTVNDRSAAERLFACGVQAVFTDRPDLWQPEEM